MMLLILLLALPLSAADLRDALLFHAGFDGGTKAAVAKGDAEIYMAANYKSEGKAGIDGSAVVIAKGRGRKGDALHFTKKNTQAVYYKAAGNVAFDAKNWTGTISFWLSLDPETDLEPGYCDPIQVTDSSFDDSAIWVDFTKDDKPRHFRLGVFGEKSEWNPRNVPADKNPAFLGRLVVEKKYPFAKGKWTHVAIVHEALGGGQGIARLYLDGKLIGASPKITEAFAWDASKAALRLGVNYTGLFDELMVFSRALNEKEVKRLSGGKL
jgi:hypothetical protein